MNEQQLFDIAYAGLAKQGFIRSYDLIRGCMYRSPDGLKCAIGQCIPDRLYTPSMDDNGTLQGILESIGYTGNYDFACELQEAHDSADDPDSMRINLMDFAHEYGLTTPNKGSGK